MEVNFFETQYKRLINIPVKQYNSKGYSKKYGNISVHEGEFSPSNFNYIIIDNKVFHINYKEDVVLNKSVIKKDKKGEEITKKYGIISGKYLVEITPDYLLNGFIDGYTPVSDYVEYLQVKYLNDEGTPLTEKEIKSSELENLILSYDNLNEEDEQKGNNICDEYKTNTNSVGYKLERNFNHLVELYKKKNSEYATNSWDSNFIKGANILGVSKEEVLLGYVTKHIVSIIDIIKGKPASLDVIKEKIGDIQVYMGLLQIMFEEKLEK